MKKITKEWLEYVESDLDNAKYCFDGRRYAAAAYFSQQLTEKIVKAYIIEVLGVTPRKSHRIEILLEDAGLDFNEIESDFIMLQELSNIYGAVKYPDIRKVSYNKKETTEVYFLLALKIYKWIKRKLRNN